MPALRLFRLLVPPEASEAKERASTFENWVEDVNRAAKHKRVTLEMVGRANRVTLHVAAEEDIAATVESTVYGAFPTMILDEVPDYVRDPDVRKLHLAGAELTLEQSDVFPIRTYEDFDTDSAASLFSVLSSAKGRGQVWVQAVIEPLPPSTRFHVKRGLRLWWGRFTQVFRVRDYLRPGGKETIQKEREDGAKQKGQMHPYKVTIRCCALAETKEEAETLMTALTGAFSAFARLEVNGFSVERIRNRATFLRAYAARRHGQTLSLSQKEIATVFHLPSTEEVPHAARVLSRRGPPPEDLPKAGEKDVAEFGLTNYHGGNQPFGIHREDRRRHLYVAGQPQMGRTRLLQLLIGSDMQKGEGLAVIDSSGDLIDSVLPLVPKERIKDVIVIDPTDAEAPVGFNPMNDLDPSQVAQMRLGMMSVFPRIMDMEKTPILKPLLASALTVVLEYQKDPTLLSLMRFLTDLEYRQSVMREVPDASIREFWDSAFNQTSERVQLEMIAPILSSVGQFLLTPMVRNIIGQPCCTLNMHEIMDKGKIVLLKVPIRILGRESASFLGLLLLLRLYAESQLRPLDGTNRDFFVYLNEGQNFVMPLFPEMLVESRRRAVGFIFAHERLSEMHKDGLKAMQAMFGSFLTFQLEADDAALMKQHFAPHFTDTDIVHLEEGEFLAHLSVRGQPREPFSGRNMVLPERMRGHARQVLASSRKRYGRPRAEVERLINEWQSKVDAQFAKPGESPGEQMRGGGGGKSEDGGSGGGGTDGGKRPVAKGRRAEPPEAGRSAGKRRHSSAPDSSTPNLQVQQEYQQQSQQRMTGSPPSPPSMLMGQQPTEQALSDAEYAQSQFDAPPGIMDRQDAPLEPAVTAWKPVE